jgi:hypothetical protein
MEGKQDRFFLGGGFGGARAVMRMGGFGRGLEVAMDGDFRRGGWLGEGCEG